jgi:hypothetical protein
MTGLPNQPYEALMARFANHLKERARRISMAEEIDLLAGPTRFKGPPLTWGKDRIAVGLLKALRARRSIVFTDEPSPVESVPSLSGHLVVCEQGEELAEVIAANYAYALRAGLFLIPKFARRRPERYSTAGDRHPGSG